MGPMQIHSKEKLQKLNEHFLSMEIYPQSNKMLAEVYVPSSIALNRWSSELIKVGQAQPENILIPKQSRVVQKSPCGDGVRLQIEFECYYIGLSEEIQKRGECQKYLQEAQMWYLMFCLAQSAASCNHIGSRIGDIRPQNILLSRGGKLKIISKLSLPNYCDPVLGQHKKKLLLSPEELQLIRKAYKQNPLDYVLSESFSIGMTLLSTGVLQDLTKCYDYRKSDINMLQFNRVLSFWQQNEFYSQLQKRTVRYSERLKGIVVGLLNINPEKRMSSLELYEILKPHMTAIMRMEPFDLDLRTASPIKKLQGMGNGGKKEVIHMLRSKKKNDSRSSPRKKEQKLEEVSGSPNLDLQFSFRSPVAMTDSKKKSVQGSTSPNRKIRLTSSFNILKHLEDYK